MVSALLVGYLKKILISLNVGKFVSLEFMFCYKFTDNLKYTVWTFSLILFICYKLIKYC